MIWSSWQAPTVPAWRGAVRGRRLSGTRRRGSPSLLAVEDALTARARASFGGRPEAAVCVILTGRAGPGRTRALRSVLTQEYRDLVVLVVDDGPCEPVATSRGARHDRGGGDLDLGRDRSTGDTPGGPLRRIVLSGVPDVVALRRNVALRSSASRWVAFLDEGSMWTPDHLQRCVELLRRGAEVAVSGVEVAGRDGAPLSVQRPTLRSGALRRGDVPDLSALVTRRTRDLRFAVWDDPATAALGERALCARLARRLHVAHLDAVTVRRQPIDDRSAG